MGIWLGKEHRRFFLVLTVSVAAHVPILVWLGELVARPASTPSPTLQMTLLRHPPVEAEVAPKAAAPVTDNVVGAEETPLVQSDAGSIDPQFTQDKSHVVNVQPSKPLDLSRPEFDAVDPQLDPPSADRNRWPMLSATTEKLLTQRRMAKQQTALLSSRRRARDGLAPKDYGWTDAFGNTVMKTEQGCFSLRADPASIETSKQWWRTSCREALVSPFEQGRLELGLDHRPLLPHAVAE